MRWLFRKRSIQPCPLPRPEEIVHTALFHRRSRGFAYRDGLVEEAVKRARMARTTDQLIDAIESAFIEFELPPWWEVGPSPTFVRALQCLGVLGCEAA